MIPFRPQLGLYAFVVAVIAGLLFAAGHYSAGVVLVVVALIIAWVRRYSERPGEDDKSYLR